MNNILCRDGVQQANSGAYHLEQDEKKKYLFWGDVWKWHVPTSILACKASELL